LPFVFCIPALLVIALFAGCAVGPDYHRPAGLGANAMPAAFGDAAIINAAIGKPPSRPHTCLVAIGEDYDDAELNRSSCSPPRTTSKLPLRSPTLSRPAQQPERPGGLLPADQRIAFRCETTHERKDRRDKRGSRTSRTFTTFNVSANASWSSICGGAFAAR